MGNYLTQRPKAISPTIGIPKDMHIVIDTTNAAMGWFGPFESFDQARAKAVELIAQGRLQGAAAVMQMKSVFATKRADVFEYAPDEQGDEE